MAKQPSELNAEMDLRGSRETEDRSYADLTDEDRLSILRNEFINQALPSVPPLRGFHLVWLSTTNQYDSLQHRARLGYTPVKAGEFPQRDFASLTIRDGAYKDCIGVNEMLLCKIPEELYQKIMNVVHGELPDREDEKLQANIARLSDPNMGKGSSLVRELGDGTEELLKRPKGNPRAWQ